MSEHFELLDVYKAFVSLLAGLILGFEREMKDKSAGLKTITVITLGSTLFSILSYKLAGTGDATRIASYIVSGIGFLGAGVIFKVGFNVHGLTTAGIIWIAAAIGMSIGFGEIYIAFTFLASALIIIYSARYLTKYFLPQFHNKLLKFNLSQEDFFKKKLIIEDLKEFSKDVTEVSLEKIGNYFVVSLDIHISTKEMEKLENYLINHQEVESFSY